MPCSSTSIPSGCSSTPRGPPEDRWSRRSRGRTGRPASYLSGWTRDFFTVMALTFAPRPGHGSPAGLVRSVEGARQRRRRRDRDRHARRRPTCTRPMTRPPPTHAPPPPTCRGPALSPASRPTRHRAGRDRPARRDVCLPGPAWRNSRGPALPSACTPRADDAVRTAARPAPVPEQGVEGGQEDVPAPGPHAERSERVGIGECGLRPPFHRDGDHAVSCSDRRTSRHGNPWYSARSASVATPSERAAAVTRRSAHCSSTIPAPVGRKGSHARSGRPTTSEAAPFAADQLSGVEKPFGRDLGLGPVPPGAALLGAAELVGSEGALGARAAPGRRRSSRRGPRARASASPWPAVTGASRRTPASPRAVGRMPRGTSTRRSSSLFPSRPVRPGHARWLRGGRRPPVRVTGPAPRSCRVAPHRADAASPEHHHRPVAHADPPRAERSGAPPRCSASPGSAWAEQATKRPCRRPAGQSSRASATASSSRGRWPTSAAVASHGGSRAECRNRA